MRTGWRATVDAREQGFQGSSMPVTAFAAQVRKQTRQAKGVRRFIFKWRAKFHYGKIYLENNST